MNGCALECNSAFVGNTAAVAAIGIAGIAGIAGDGIAVCGTS